MEGGEGGGSIVYIVFKRGKLTVAVSKFLYLFIYREVGLFCFALFFFMLNERLSLSSKILPALI